MLSAESSLPLQLEKTNGKKGRYMPISKYFKGKGRNVMADMKDRYGDKKGESVFYATANKNSDMKPAAERPKRKTLGQRIAERD